MNTALMNFRNKFVIPLFLSAVTIVIVMSLMESGKIQFSDFFDFAFLFAVVSCFVALGIVIIGIPSAILIKKINIHPLAKVFILATIGTTTGFLVFRLESASEFSLKLGAISGFITALIWCALNFKYLKDRKLTNG